MAELFADVAVRLPRVRQAAARYTYHVPPALRGSISEGALVWVPFGRQRLQGIVLALYVEPPAGPSAGLVSAGQAAPIRPIEDLADPDVVLPPHLLALARWVCHYYRVSLWEALELLLPPGVAQETLTTWRVTASGLAAELGALPPAERGVLYFLRRNGATDEPTLHASLHGSPAELRRVCTALAERGLIQRGRATSRAAARPKHERVVKLLRSPEELTTADATLRRAPRQVAVLQTLAERSLALSGAQADPDAPPLVPAQDLPLPILRELARRGWIAIQLREVLRNPLDGAPIAPDVPPPLSPAQARALQPIATALNERRQVVFLVHGVTGSGKTELYLRAIARALRLGRQALVLVPEIALTAQLVRRFAARFGERVVVLHSGLSLGERYDTWRRLRRGAARVVVGSRSAVFAPLPELGLIVVDEEHEPSYKHEEGVRYHARDVALELARLTGSVVILGSATPSLESYQRARDGVYTLLELRERVALARDGVRTRSLPLPPVRIIDMRVELQQGNRSIFSRALQQALQQALERRQQAILFLNRRGTAAFMMCRDCGHVIGCPRCSTPLTLHRIDDASSGYELLRCHTCSHRQLPPQLCPQCWSARIRQFGIGTQRVVAEVEALFPEARVLRWDRDVTGRKGAHERLLQSFLDHEADVLVGTQMIAKGLDLPLVTLVGVVSADTGLHQPDFRAGERAFQLMAQVAGRAGRRDLGGQVIIQSYTPDHYALQAAALHDYHAFFREEIAFRREAHYPPFAQLVRFIRSGTRPEALRREAEALAERLTALIERLRLPDAALIGPAPAFMERVRGRYRWHLLLRAPSVHPLLDALGPLPGWIIDVDPVSLI
ncbi:primosomal protein N' [Kallotenue papyrolyticum]|uniref:primosomal protein N' n=1 Tax=Kallotenue papyrolyticum TaxID=1325125 RepID=UPI0004926EB0|nr:primosomal protein N' [Kallotenue papyrolyticum]